MREVAKFLAGFAGNQFLTHGALAVSGTRFSIFGIDYTPELNTGAAVIWGVLMLSLAYYAWMRRGDAGQR